MYSFGLSLFAILSGIFLATTAQSAQTSFSTKYLHFDVYGTSIEELWESINKNGPKSRLGVGHAGYTTFKLDSPVRFVTKNDKCHISSARFQMVSTIQLPRWRDRSNSSDEVKLYWHALFTDVKRHEEDHVKIANDAISELAQKVANLKPQKTCKQLNRTISRIANANRRELNRAQKQFEGKEIRGQKKRLQRIIETLRAN